MTPSPGTAFLHVSILAGLVLACNAKGSFPAERSPLSAWDNPSNCSEEITVHRNTLYHVRVGQEFRINCTVLFCGNAPPKVTWYKNNTTVLTGNSIRIEESWTKSKQELVSSLIFKNIQLNDSGRYHCKTNSPSVSHAITIFITRENNTQSPAEDGPAGSPSKQWTYIYSAAATCFIVVAVIVGTVLTLWLRRGRAEKAPKAGNLYISIEDRPLAKRSPREDLPVPRRVQGTDLTEPKHKTGRINATHKTAQATEEREKQEENEEGASIVYASLDHQEPLTGTRRPLKPPKEEPSMYASLRVP